MKDIMKENYMFDTENVTSVSKNMIVVCYDISDNKRRNQMEKLLERYLFRVQRSVFEAMLTKQKTKQLNQELARFAKDDDNIRIYKINGSGDVTVYGNAQVLEDEEIIII